MQLYYGPKYITLLNNYVNHKWFIDLIHGVISLPDATSCDNTFVSQRIDNPNVADCEWLTLKTIPLSEIPKHIKHLQQSNIYHNSPR